MRLQKAGAAKAAQAQQPGRRKRGGGDDALKPEQAGGGDTSGDGSEDDAMDVDADDDDGDRRDPQAEGRRAGPTDDDRAAARGAALMSACAPDYRRYLALMDAVQGSAEEEELSGWFDVSDQGRAPGGWSPALERGPLVHELTCTRELLHALSIAICACMQTMLEKLCPTSRLVLMQVAAAASAPCRQKGGVLRYSLRQVSAPPPASDGGGAWEDLLIDR